MLSEEPEAHVLRVPARAEARAEARACGQDGGMGWSAAGVSQRHPPRRSGLVRVWGAAAWPERVPGARTWGVG